MPAGLLLLAEQNLLCRVSVKGPAVAASRQGPAVKLGAIPPGSSINWNLRFHLQGVGAITLQPSVTLPSRYAPQPGTTLCGGAEVPRGSGPWLCRGRNLGHTPASEAWLHPCVRALQPGAEVASAAYMHDAQLLQGCRCTEHQACQQAAIQGCTQVRRLARRAERWCCPQWPCCSLRHSTSASWAPSSASGPACPTVR